MWLGILFSRNMFLISTIKISKEVRDTKFLGVILDNELDWSCHIHELNKKLRSAAALLSKVRHWIPREHYLNIYNALVESHLTYGISVWGGVSDSKLNKIFTVQCTKALH